MLTIPDRFKQLLETNNKLSGMVQLSLSTFEELFYWSKLPFFPDYTDHGKKHIQNVLNAADLLIAESAESTLTAEDITVLVISTLLHDAGMHISTDGFQHLIASSHQPIADLDRSSWRQLWEEFGREVRRFDGKTLVRLFGSSDAIRVPVLRKESWDDKDLRIIGEFIRRHHARIAHEIAIYGLPGSDKRLKLPADFDKELADLAGLVARSHGMPLRSCFSYLKSKFDLRQFRGVHGVFLMAILRIADYLQIDSDRAPASRFQLASIRSPLSTAEWNAHQAVRNIHPQTEDPEAIFVQGKPDTVDAFIKLKHLLAGLQSELDTTWAVLGEVYGRYMPLRHLGLSLRRVISNLDDGLLFSATVPYVPMHVSFETADADLLKLLVAPLYGNDPNIGIRELLQNAVDACLELRDSSEFNSIRDLIIEQQADVVVSFKKTDEGFVLTVSDRGSGMTAEIIRDYFLKAGASYRKSEAWRIAHEDTEGHSKIMRSGRFGVGLLAAFLIGDTIKVSTRHFQSARGLEFEANIDTDNIELRHVERPIGTTITIIPRQAEGLQLLKLFRCEYQFDQFGSLPDRMYFLGDPSVKFLLDSQEHLTTVQWPNCGATLPKGWHRLNAANFADVHWTYTRTIGREYELGKLVCNGIAVGPYAQAMKEQNLGLVLNVPTLSVFDPDGRLPLTLTRNSVNSLPFEHELLLDISRNIIAFSINETHDIRNQGKCSHVALNLNSSPYVFTKDGFTFQDSWVINQLNLKALVLFSFGDGSFDIAKQFGAGTALIYSPAVSYFSYTRADQFIRDICESIIDRQIKRWELPISGGRIMCPSHLADRWMQRLPKYLTGHLRKEKTSFSNWSMLVGGDAQGEPIMDLGPIAKSFPETEAIEGYVITEFYCSKRQSEIQMSPMGEVLSRELGTTVIPYDKAKRELLPGTKELSSRFTSKR